jgi:hypothetical protein
VQFNADKELLFITVPGQMGTEVEKVIEMEHIEIIPPFVNIGTKFMTANDPDGFFILKDMNKNESFILSKRKA